MALRALFSALAVYHETDNPTGCLRIMEGWRSDLEWLMEFPRYGSFLQRRSGAPPAPSLVCPFLPALQTMGMTAPLPFTLRDKSIQKAPFERSSAACAQRRQFSFHLPLDRTVRAWYRNVW